MAVYYSKGRRIMTVDTRRGLVAVGVLMVISAAYGAVLMVAPSYFGPILIVGGLIKLALAAYLRHRRLHG